jgi:hypothetical protein
MGRQFLAFLRTVLPNACPEGCYKHYVNGRWICCKCGK